MQFRAKLNYKKLVSTIIKLNNKCIEVIQSNPDTFIDFADVEHLLKETVAILNKDLDKLFEFAYELRKQEKRQNQHSTMLLKGNVKPAILAEIILSN